MPYPDTLDSFTNPLASDPRVGHAQLHSDVNDAVEALQAKVGIDGTVGGNAYATPPGGLYLLASDNAGTSVWVDQTTAVSDTDFYIDRIRKATVTLSSAQLLDLHNTPVELVPAPGAGKWLNPHQVAVYTTFGTVAYTVNDTPALRYDGDTTDLVNLQNVGSAASSVGLLPVTNGGNIAATAAVNKALTLAVLSAITDGDGTLTITVWYSIEDVP